MFRLKNKISILGAYGKISLGDPEKRSKYIFSQQRINSYKEQWGYIHDESHNRGATVIPRVTTYDWSLLPGTEASSPTYGPGSARCVSLWGSANRLTTESS